MCCPSHSYWCCPICIFDAWAQPHDVMPPRIRIGGVPSHSFGDISSASFLYASSMHGRLLSAASRLCHSICIFDAWAQPHDVMPPRIRIGGVPSHSFGDISSASFLYASSMHGRLLSAASRLCHSICIFDAWAQPHISSTASMLWVSIYSLLGATSVPISVWVSWFASTMLFMDTCFKTLLSGSMVVS